MSGHSVNVVCVVFLMFSLFRDAVSVKYFLNGTWLISNGKNVTDIPGKVPGGVYTALMNNNIIGDPFYRYNDQQYKWVGEMDWSYRRIFNVTSDMLQESSIVLVCDGLDTIATVSINGQVVGKANNMFARYVYDIKEVLQVGTNTIQIDFMSAVVYARKKAQSIPYPIPPPTENPAEHGESHANMIRKEQCSFAWDWGPSFPNQGIWRVIYIEPFSSAVLRDITAETINNNNGTWTLVVEAFTQVTAVSNTGVRGTMSVVVSDTTLSVSDGVTLTETNNKVRLEIIVEADQLKLWWPNGHGDQPLYKVNVTFTDMQGRTDSRTMNVGFRTVELVQDYASSNKSQGRLFYFRINGRPIFFKGSNWIPADIFKERVKRDRVYNYLKSAADANMNALRVWGGGVYESRMFYDICDELGIMIWQDFMFASALYPTDEEFLASVRQEVTYQIRTIKHHPSIIVLSGNNENEIGIARRIKSGEITNATLYKSDYVKLYIDTIYAIVKQEDTSRPFVPSSPSNGLETEAEGWVAENPKDTHYGDLHEYRYVIPFYEPSQYSVSRFTSEYGVQSFPSYESLVPVYDEKDMDYFGDLNEFRNHHHAGNKQMLIEADFYLKRPNNTDKIQEFKDLIYVTQIDHAIAVRTATEHLRRWQNQLDQDGQGNTMGALYWMLADIWQAPTWASIEYGGKWKMLHYYAKHFFAPTLLSPFINGDDLGVYLLVDGVQVNEIRQPSSHRLYFQLASKPKPSHLFDDVTRDVRSPAYTGTLYIELYTWSSLYPLKIWTEPFKVNSTAESIYHHNIDDLLKQADGVDRSRCFIIVHLGDKVNGPTNWLPLTTFKEASGLKKANIEIKEINVQQTPGEFNIQLETNNVAPFVWLEALGVEGRFSDNGFLLHDATRNVTFYAWETVALERLYKSLSIKSLLDIY